MTNTITEVARWYRERGLIEGPDPVPFSRQVEKIDEEMVELDDAIKSGDRAHIAKELADVLFVVGGALVIHAGGEDKALECWRQLMLSNNSKPMERDATGKIVKGPDFVDADMAAVLGGEG